MIRSAAILGFLLGAAFAWQLAAFYRVGCFAHDEPLSVLLPLVLPPVTSATCAGIGWLAPRAWLLSAPLVAMVGTLTGATIGAMWWPPDGLLLGAVDGFVFGLAAAVLLAPFSLVLSERARDRSALERASKLTLTSIAGAIASLACLLTRVFARSYPMCAPTDAPNLTAVTGALLSVATAVLLIVHHASITSRVARPVGYLDLGVGDEISEHPGPLDYRTLAARPAVLKGEPALALRSSRRRAHAASLGAALAIGCAVVARLMTR